MNNFSFIFEIVPEDDKYSDSVSGKVRLTLEGTNHFKSLDDAGRKDFHENLRKELANAIPINLNRITSSENVETDSSVTPKRIFLSINIERDEIEQEISVNFAIKYLNELIKHKSITVIGSGESSKYLDQDYGYKPFRKNFVFILASRKEKSLKKTNE